MEKSENLGSWFHREVYQWRLGASVVWTVLSVPAFFTLYFLLVSFSLFHPSQWITDFLSGVVSLSFWSTLLFLMSVIGGISVYNSTHFTVTPEIAITRASAVTSLCKPSCLVHGAVLSLAGGVIVRWCCGLIGGHYASLADHCSEGSEKYCLNEPHLFIILHGVFVGFVCHLQFWLKQEKYIRFPAIQQAKFFTVKSNVWPLLTNSLLFELKYLKYFYISYYLFGHIPRNWMLINMNLEARDTPPLNSIFGLISFGLLWETMLSGVFLHFLFSYSAFFYRVYIAESFEFPIETVYEEFKNKCLHNALVSSNFPLVKYLGYQDLQLLSGHSKSRRRQLFTLSQPGGHPHNWNSIYRSCLSEVDALTRSLQENNWKAGEPLRHSSGENTATTHGNQVVTNLTFRGASLPAGGGGGGASSTGNETKKPDDPMKKIVDDLKKRAVFKYFLADLPEASVQKLFSSSQTQIWAIEALSAIVAASFSEDPYGVVQRSLPEIIGSLLNLQENVEKHFKLSPVVCRRGQNNSPSYIGLRYSLRSALKMSLYRIVNTFGSHLSEIKISPEHSKRLKLFMDYKE